MESSCNPADTGLSSRVPDAMLTRFRGFTTMHGIAVKQAETALDSNDLDEFWRWANFAKRIRQNLDTLLSQTAIGRAVKASTTQQERP